MRSLRCPRSALSCVRALRSYEGMKKAPLGVAEVTSTALLLGEKDLGKNLTAQLIHELSQGGAPHVSP